MNLRKVLNYSLPNSDDKQGHHCKFLPPLPPPRPILHNSGKTAVMLILLFVEALTSSPPHKNHMDFLKKFTSYTAGVNVWGGSVWAVNHDNHKN